MDGNDRIRLGNAGLVLLALSIVLFLLFFSER
jgi:hypothetical protein